MRTTLILIDEDDSARRALKRMLAAAGHDVVSLSDVAELGEQALPKQNALLLVECADCAIAARKLLEGRTPSETVPVIVLAKTGAAEDTERAQAHAIEASAWLRKPVDGPALLDTIRWALEAQTHRPNSSARKGTE